MNKATRDKNIRMADFMGWDKKKVYGDGTSFYVPRTLNNKYPWVPADQLRFHFSWDWLMPVVDKVRYSGMEVENVELYNKLFKNSVKWFLSNDREKVYKAVNLYLKNRK